MPSPCGSNCLYTLLFEGPYLECNSSTIEYTKKSVDSDLDIEIQYHEAKQTFNATRSPPERVDILADLLTTVGPIPDSPELNTTDYNITLYNMSCTPSRAQYTLTNSYENNNQRITYSATPLGRLENVTNGTPVLGLGFDSDGKWNQNNVDWYRDANLLAIFKAMFFPLEGSYVVDGLSLLERTSNCSLVEGGKGISCRTPQFWEGLDRPSDGRAAGKLDRSFFWPLSDRPYLSECRAKSWNQRLATVVS